MDYDGVFGCVVVALLQFLKRFSVHHIHSRRIAKHISTFHATQKAKQDIQATVSFYFLITFDDAVRRHKLLIDMLNRVTE